MKFLSVLLIMVMGLQAFSQEQLNEYKYIIVPKRFDGFRSENQYQTSTLIKYYFVQKGFNTIYDDALPQDLESDRCLGLNVKMDNASSMFATKLEIVLNDCEGNEVYRTREGMSKVKEYNLSYREAIREAFSSLGEFKHNYNPQETNDRPLTVSFKDDVKILTLVEEDTSEVPVPVEQQTLPKGLPEPVEDTNDVLEEKGEMLNEAQEEVKEVSDVTATDLALYAQKTPIGYQLVDTAPSIQFLLKETSMSGVYLAEGKNKKGLVFMKDNQWVFEYYEGNKRMEEVLLIKF